MSDLISFNLSKINYFFCFSGYQAAAQQFETHTEIEKEGRLNRIMFLTDAVPSTTEDGQLRKYCAEWGAKSVHTTFVGIGVDFGVQV